MKINKQHYIWISVAVVAATCFGALLMSGRSSGPVYKGKTVAEWLDQSPPRSLISTNVEVREMLVALGSNAVPSLLRILNEGSSRKFHLLSVLSQQGWLPARLRIKAQTNLFASATRMHQAVDAFDFLGSKAISALPALEELATRFSDGSSASAALSAFGAVARNCETFPAVLRVATNAPLGYRFFVDSWLKSLLYRSHTELALQASLALCELGSSPPEAIPPLVQCIASVRSPHRKYALQALRKLAPQYAAARDAIREASEGDEPAIRDVARAILAEQLATNPPRPIE